MTTRTPATDDPNPRVVALIAELAGPWASAARVVPTARLREDLGMDSLARVALAARIGEDTGADPGECFEEFATVVTVGDVQALHRRLSGGTGRDPAASTLDRLVRLLGRLGPEAPDTAGLDPAAPLRDLGLPSMALVEFFVRIEEEFAFTWDEDTAPEVFRTLAALAAHLDAHAGPSVGVRPVHPEPAP
ncbi:phosphopantetheine-binding protein [Embleya sp. NPDC008237]|uniref:phosphopantetheine-binding protein n=1 Tax=Embleya sp. NPDC008237 TaxID=3363978 RepID=UPI0036EB327E